MKGESDCTASTSTGGSDEEAFVASEGGGEVIERLGAVAGLFLSIECLHVI